MNEKTKFDCGCKVSIKKFEEIAGYGFIYHNHCNNKFLEHKRKIEGTIMFKVLAKKW